MSSYREATQADVAILGNFWKNGGGTTPTNFEPVRLCTEYYAETNLQSSFSAGASGNEVGAQINISNQDGIRMGMGLFQICTEGRGMASGTELSSPYNTPPSDVSKGFYYLRLVIGDSDYSSNEFDEMPIVIKYTPYTYKNGSRTTGSSQTLSNIFSSLESKALLPWEITNSSSGLNGTYNFITSISINEQIVLNSGETYDGDQGKWIFQKFYFDPDKGLNHETK